MNRPIIAISSTIISKTNDLPVHNEMSSTGILSKFIPIWKKKKYHLKISTPFLLILLLLSTSHSEALFNKTRTAIANKIAEENTSSKVQHQYNQALFVSGLRYTQKTVLSSFHLFHCKL